MDKLDEGVQQRIMTWIEKQLHDIDFPTTPEKVLTRDFAKYIRFRVSNYT